MEHILLWTFHFGRDSDASVRMVSIHPLTFIGLILNNPDCWEVLVYGVALIIRLFQHTFFSHTPSNFYQQAIQSIQGPYHTRPRGIVRGVFRRLLALESFKSLHSWEMVTGSTFSA